ncbi:hypothetical protein ECE50_012140 [Chitinophaga sp. Mgbs1]|uniref:Uncharacterized protein n=1 Tax=Chitinophaga solisilvae TaxID=1233460 RepID=A0A3S1CNA2_9BACT|nr:hypothetical protein [Chitinophaga solisilvae]
MKPLYFLLPLAVVAASCQQNGQQANKNTDSLKTSPVNMNTCFAKISGKDSVILHINIQDGNAGGELTYNYFEKDKNTGTLKGQVADGILRADYQFMSEGMQSSRPVVFKISGEQAWEAVADSINPEGIPVFAADNNALHFDSIPLKEISCKP